MAVLTADHFIGDDEGFREVLTGRAVKSPAQDHLVTLGITPSSPSTGYGYIERGRFLMNANGFAAYQVVAFREKPDLVTAKHFVMSGKHSWNSGMFVWKVSRFLDELSRTMPEFYQQLMQIEAALGTPDYDRVLHEVWPAVQVADGGLWRDGEGARCGGDSGRVRLERRRFVGDAAGDSGQRRARQRHPSRASTSASIPATRWSSAAIGWWRRSGCTI